MRDSYSPAPNATPRLTTKRQSNTSVMDASLIRSRVRTLRIGIGKRSPRLHEQGTLLARIPPAERRSAPWRWTACTPRQGFAAGAPAERGREHGSLETKTEVSGASIVPQDASGWSVLCRSDRYRSDHEPGGTARRNRDAHASACTATGGIRSL